MYYGTVSGTNKQIVMDRRNAVVSANRIICGQTGAGKTFMMQNEISHIFSETEDSVFELTDGKQLQFTLEAIQRNHAKGRKTWIFIDEIGKMLKHQQYAELLCRLADTAEQYSSILTMATQDMCSLFETETGNMLLSDVNFLTFLSLSQKQCEVLCRYFRDIVPECVVERYCGDVSCGKGIFVVESKLLNPESVSHIEVMPFVFHADK